MNNYYAYKQINEPKSNIHSYRDLPICWKNSTFKYPLHESLHRAAHARANSLS